MIFVARQYRNGKLIKTTHGRNTFTREGARYILEWGFLDAETIKDWKIGLIETGAPALTDTAASKGFTEFTDVTVFGGRPDLRGISPFVERVASGQYRFNGEADDYFTATAAGTVLGAFIESDSTIGGPPPVGTILWAGALFASPLSVSISDQIQISSYIVNAQVNDSIGAP